MTGSGLWLWIQRGCGKGIGAWEDERIVAAEHGRDRQPGAAQPLEAPSWLWTSVLDLTARHEVGYLEHCRKIRTDPAAHV